MGQNPKIQIVPPVNIPIQPLKSRRLKMGGEFTNQPNWDPKTVLTLDPQPCWTWKGPKQVTSSREADPKTVWTRPGPRPGFSPATSAPAPQRSLPPPPASPAEGIQLGPPPEKPHLRGGRAGKRRKQKEGKKSPNCGLAAKNCPKPEKKGETRVQEVNGPEKPSDMFEPRENFGRFCALLNASPRVGQTCGRPTPPKFSAPKGWPVATLQRGLERAGSQPGVVRLTKSPSNSGLFPISFTRTNLVDVGRGAKN